MHSPGQRDGRLQSNRVLLCIILTTFMVLLWQPRLPSPSAEAQTPYGTSQPSLQEVTIVGSQVGMLQNMLLTGLTCERTGWGWWKPTVCKWQPQP